MDASPPLPLLRTTLRVLSFRISQDELLRLDRRHLVFGLVCTWLVGMGRYWDDPGAHLLQHLGLGSVLYVFALALLLWALVWPLRPEGWTYSRVLTFVTLVSSPAVLYAIPVERLLSLATSREVNVWFLLVVASWRVALLFFLLFRLARLGWLQVLVAALLPLAAIVTALTVLNLERAVFDVMSGLREDAGTANDEAYAVLFLLTLLSSVTFVPLVVLYGALVAHAWWKRRRGPAPVDADAPAAGGTLSGT